MSGSSQPTGKPGPHTHCGDDDCPSRVDNLPTIPGGVFVECTAHTDGQSFQVSWDDGDSWESPIPVANGETESTTGTATMRAIQIKSLHNGNCHLIVRSSRSGAKKDIHAKTPPGGVPPNPLPPPPRPKRLDACHAPHQDVVVTWVLAAVKKPPSRRVTPHEPVSDDLSTP